MLVALIVFGATGAWAAVTQGPWTYMDYRTGCCDRDQNPAISFNGLNNSHWATVDGPWCDGDGVGFTVKSGKANKNQKNGVFSTYYIDQTLESYSRKVLTWTFVLGSQSKKHYSNTCLYGLQGTWDQINALTVDFTEEYSNKTGSGNLLAQFRNITLSGNGVFTSNYVKTFAFDNRSNANSATKSWCLLLTHVVSSADPVDGMHEWGSFRHVSATWTTYYYKYVTFNANGGSGSMNKQTVENSGKLTANAFSRTGYTFDGWATSSTGSKAYNNQGDISATSGSKGNVTLYARWKANTYTVTLNQQSGTGGSASVTATYAAAMPSMTVPTRTGYTFQGYFTEANGKGTKYYNANGSSAKNWDKTAATTLYAYWTANTYTVTLDMQGGESGSASVTATYAAAMPTMTVPTRSSYTFGGYYTEAKGAGTKYYNANGSSAKNWDKTAATTLYAYWTPVPYAITYNLEGGTDTGNPTSYTIETETFTLKAPVREDYTFLGWTGSNGEEVQLTVTIANGSTEDKSYTAHWEANDAILQELHTALGEKVWTGYGVNTGVICYSRGDEPKEFRATIMGGTYTFDIPFRDVNSITKTLNTDESVTYTLNVSLPAQTGMASETLRVTLKDGEITGMESENAGLEMSKEGAEITDWAALQTAMNNGGVIKLTADVTAAPADAALTVPAGKTVVLDLNGFTINRAMTAPAANGSVIVNNGTLAIQTTNGGKITGGKTTGNGGGILNNGVLTLYGGEITGNKASGMGGGVYNAAAAPTGFWMTGGLIDGNTAGSFAAIGGDVTFSNMAVVQVNAAGSTVSNTTAKTGMVKYDYIQPVMPDLEKFAILSELYAALGNETWTGYGVNTGVISYSRGDEMNEFRATFMGGNYTLDVPFGDFTAASKAENTDGSFTYTLELPLPAYTGLSSETVKITTKDGKITGLQSENAGLDMNKEAGEITGWAALQAAVNNGGVIKLTTDVTAAATDEALTVPAGKTVVIDLNGHTLNRALTTPTDNGSVIINNGTLAIMDNAGNGKITGGNTITIGGAVLNNGAFTLYGGEITGNKAFDAGGGVYSTADELPGGFWMTGGLIDGNTAGSFAAIGGKVTFNKQAAVQVNADGTVVDINTAAADMMSYSYIRPALPSVDQMMTTPAQQANGAWQAYMPAGNRMLRVTYKDEPQLAWVDKDKQPVTAISGYHGFQPLVAIPNIKASNKFFEAAEAGTSVLEAFSSNQDVVSVVGISSFLINGVGEADLAVIHRNDADFKYDSAAFHVTVLAPDTLNLLTNNADWGTVAAVTPLSDSVRAGEGNTFFAVPEATMTVEATPAEGFHLRYWSNGAAVDATLRAKAQVQGNTDLLAFFAPDTVPAKEIEAPHIFDTLVYNSYAQTILINGEAEGGQFKYSLDSIEWSTELPQIKDAGTHTFYYYIDSTDVLHRALPVQTRKVTIAKAPLTITAENKEVVYGFAAPGFSVSYYGLKGGDLPADVLTGELSYACDYTAGSNVASYNIVPSGQTSANYDITYVKGTLNVLKADPAFTDPVANTLTYNGGAQTLVAAGETEHGTFEYTFTPNDEESWSTALPQAKDAGTYGVYYRVVGDHNHLDYESADAVVVTIAKAALTATADNKAIIYGEYAPEFTVTYDGWQGEDKDMVLTGAIAFETNYTRGNDVGDYTIIPSGVEAANYTVTFVNGTLTVNRKSAESSDIMAAQEDGEQLVYTNAVNKPTIFVKDTTLTLTEEKDYTLTFVSRGETEYTESATAPTHAGDYTAKITFIGNYKDMLTVDFAISKAPLTITADDKENIFGEEAPEFTVSYEGFLGTDDKNVLTGSQAYACEYKRGDNVGDYTIVPSGVDAHDYVITFVNGTLTVNRKSAKDADIAAVQLAGEALVYDAEVNRPSIVVTDTTLTLTEEKDYVLTFIGTANDASVYEEAAVAPTKAGDYTAIVAFVGNYIDTLTVDFTIAKAPLTITADDKAVIYGEYAPKFTVSYEGWQGTDDNTVLLGTQAYDCEYAPGSYIGTYTITPKDVTAHDYAITFVDGTLTVNQAEVKVSGADIQEAKFEDGNTTAVVLNAGQLEGIKLNDPIGHNTTATFSDAAVGEGKTITMFYELTGDAALLANYNLTPTSEIFAKKGVIIENFVPNDNPEEKADDETEVKEGIEVYAYGYCLGDSVGMSYHLNSGNPDQYKIEFEDSHFTDVDWTDLDITGPDGIIYIEVPVDVPTGDYQMTVTFRDSRFPWLESNALNVTFHVNLPQTYVTPMFDNTIALVDTCECFTDIQWYHRADASEAWQPIAGATGHYYRPADGSKLTGEYFVKAKMNGVDTYTCGQSDMETLYGADKTPKAQVSAYPNPVVNTTTVTIENSENWNHSLRVVNLTGVEMFRTTFEGNETTVDMGGFVQGNYMISVDGIVVKVMKK